MTYRHACANIQSLQGLKNTLPKRCNMDKDADIFILY